MTWFKDVTLFHCMAHARRKFDEALGNDKQRAEHALTEVQKLDALERKAKNENFTSEQRSALRQEEATPILKALEQWMKSEYPSVTPESPIDKETEKRFVFLTNNFDLAPEDVALLYKYRWKIELFFKWIKQHLKVKSFWGTSFNTVKIQIYIAIITYCLVVIIKSKLKSGHSN